MDPPPTTTSSHHSYPDSFDSSPRSRTTDSCDDALPPQPPTATKLRLMCSYNGHIVPRPHDRSLCYLGGDTRMVVVDRHSSLSDLTNRLSKTLLNGNSFTLKYQLPSEDLDSLITVTTDEDLENMIEEYDRTAATTGTKAKPSRLRLFLFPTSKVESVSSIGSLVDGSKSENWFVEALNGNGVGVLSRDGSTTINSLLGLDGDDRNGNGNGSSLGNYVKQVKGSSQDVHSIPDSPMLDTNSSFGSTSSMPSMSSLPPIRLHVEDNKVGLEDQFAQMNVSSTATAVAGISATGATIVVQKQDDGFVIASRPPIPTTFLAVTGVPASTITPSGLMDSNNRILSDDERSERSEQGAGNVFAKPTQLQQRTNGGMELASPDGGSRDNSFPEAMPLPNPTYYQDSVVQVASRDNRIPDLKRETPNPNYQIQMQQIHDSGYVLTSQLDQLQQHQYQQQQQQFIPVGVRYIQQQTTGHMPLPSYYQIHPQQNHQHQQQLDQQYPVYYVAVPQSQAYNYQVQSNISETTNVPLSRSPIPPNSNISNMLPTPTVYMEQVASGFPSRAAPTTKPEMAASMYRATIPATSRVVQVPAEPQYVGYPQHQAQNDSQAIPSVSATATTNYGYEYSDPGKSQIYHTQPHGTALPPQFQTTNPAATMTAAEALTQLPSDITNQQMRTPQP